MWTGHEKYALSSDFDIPIMTCRAIFLPLVGYYLDSVLDIRTITRKRYLLLTIATVSGVIISCVFCYYQGTRTEDGFTTDYNSMFYYLTTIWLFITVKRIYFTKYIQKHIHEGAAKAIRFCSSLTFGIYLFDPILKDTSGINQALYSLLNRFMPTLMSAIIWCMVSFIICGIITALLKKIPGIKKFI